MSMVATLSLSGFLSRLLFCLPRAGNGGCLFTSTLMRLPHTSLLEFNKLLLFRVAHLLCGRLLPFQRFSFAARRTLHPSIVSF
ncbi:hypothetical protein EDD16DRAFT_1687378 [Pisolithus croceorrhizus]|nr:hypothetical protein EDD16DRAFT_1687378 [Pisolithus croceorrhizus]KAI6115096.1 hypothetical protein EV401DRAFT_1977429 [Pisolithus croceorrhizus]KAI6158588.1 hypothetical protein EDD17DRAFT_1622375 [Pisolithus thermaeus]